MRKSLKIILCVLMILFSVVTFSTNAYAEEITIDGNQAIYSNEEYGYSTKIPIDGYIFFNNTVYCDGKKQEIAGEDLNVIFKRMEAAGTLFIYSDYDFAYEISCSIMPCDLKLYYYWDEYCKKMANGVMTTSNQDSKEIADAVQEQFGEFFDDSTYALLNDYYDNATFSTEIINNYRYLVINYQGMDSNTYTLQYVTTIGDEQFFFKYFQQSGNPSKEVLNRFYQMIKFSNLPLKPEQASNTAAFSNNVYEKLTESIIVRLTVFLGILAIIYGLRFLVCVRKNKDELVLWNPEIDFTEIPFSDSLSLREHILKDPYNLSFLTREDALHLAESKKPYLPFGLLGIWIIGTILTITESIITARWWILLFIPIGFIIPSYSRHIFKSWTQIIPIAIGTIFSDPVVFYLCVDFVIIRSLYDLWYSSVLKTAGEVVCADDSLFSQGWEDTALAVMVDGEPYFHKKRILNEKPIATGSSSSEDIVPKETAVNDPIRYVSDIIAKDVAHTLDFSQNMAKDHEPQEKET